MQLADNSLFLRGAAKILVAVLMSVTPYAASTACAVNAPEEATNKLFGQWARNVAECTRPYFVFSAATATIQLDADGTPTSFHYPKVAYAVKGDEVVVNLHKRHPVGKTSSKTALQFVIQPDGSAVLQMLKQKTLHLVRCPTAT